MTAVATLALEVTVYDDGTASVLGLTGEHLQMFQTSAAALAAIGAALTGKDYEVQAEPHEAVTAVDPGLTAATRDAGPGLRSDASGSVRNVDLIG